MSYFEKKIKNNEKRIEISYYTVEELNKEVWNKLNQKINKVLDNIKDLSKENIISTMRTILKNYNEEYFKLLYTEKDNGVYYICYFEKNWITI